MDVQARLFVVVLKTESLNKYLFFATFNSKSKSSSIYLRHSQ